MIAVRVHLPLLQQVPSRAQPWVLNVLKEDSMPHVMLFLVVVIKLLSLHVLRAAVIEHSWLSSNSYH